MLTINVVSVRNLVKRYPRGNVLANDNITFDLKAGEIFGLLGPNGAGKTTLLRQLMGLLRPTSGNIYIFNHEVTGNTHLVPHLVSYVTQRPLALADLRAREALVITGHIRGLTRREAKKQASRLIEEFSLENLASSLIGRLSGGEQRLVGFCLALSNRRPLLVLDEPTNDLDPVHRKLIWDKLQDLNREEGTTIILVTHNVTEAERVLKRVGIINHGRIQAIGTVGELKAKVDNNLRLELLFKEDAASPAQEEVLRSSVSGSVKPLDNNRWLVHIERHRSKEEINTVLTNIGMEILEDIRILSPTLEDVYLQLGGGERLAKTG